MTPSAPTGPVLVDFNDAVAPMVVKELRQGLRTRAFTWAFLVIQAMLLLSMLSGLSNDNDSRGSAGFFWTLLQLALLIVMPFRGLNALHTEVRLNTMELITLTRMSAWRIVSGKWLALVSQSLLLAVAVMPYIVLRYFFGGMNVIAELVVLAVVIGLSALITALMVALSVVSNFLVRCFFTIPVLILVIRFMGEAVYRISRGDNPSPFDLSILGWAGILPAAVFLGYYLLDAAASRIAPQAVNYVTRRRVAGLAAFLISVVVAHWTAEAAFLAYPLFFFALLALDALTEHPATVDSVYAPFRRNPLTRVLEHFLAPGWYTGTWFVLLLGVILTIANAVSPGLWRASASDGSQEVIGIIIGFVASALLPLAIMLLPRERSQQPIVTYCLLVIFMGVISATLIQFVDHGDIPALAWLGMVLPPLSTYAMLRADSFESPELVTILGILVVLTIVSITIIARKWNKIHLAMRRAQREDLTV